MYRVIFAAVMAAGLIAAPLAPLAQTAPAKTETKADAKPKKNVSGGQAEMRERQKKCGAEWKEAKAAGKTEKGMTWPKYWSACNTRLKGSA